MNVALDANLLLLLVIGQTSRRLIGRHKRLQSYTVRDFEQLRELVGEAERVITTPNTMTEVGNLAPSGTKEPYRAAIIETLAGFAAGLFEIYVPSRDVCRKDDFNQFGLSDAVWLHILEPETIFLTADRDLYLAALSRGHVSYHIDDLRK